MNAPDKGAMALETRKESGQMSLEAVHSSRRAPVNLIDTALLEATNRALGACRKLHRCPAAVVELRGFRNYPIAAVAI